MAAAAQINLDDCFEIAKKAALAAGQVIREAYLKPIVSLQTKTTNVDLVTETDKKAEEVIIAIIKEKFPDHFIIGEESVSDGAPCIFTDQPTWIIDPLDGTTNFVHRFPFVAPSICFSINKEPVIGVVYGCILNEMFTAIKGRGAFLNDERISVSKREKLSEAIVGTEFGSSREEPRMTTLVKNMYKLAAPPICVHSIRALGSAALNLCYVARGALDIYYEFGPHIWDYSAGHVILTEAGGVTLDPSSKPIDFMARKILGSATHALAIELCNAIEQIETTRDGEDDKH
eukprot:TRINITY_DN342_c0_g2_i1.p1 TRINITY_DN342_c0_g2~~TRINITY_DN342_c0_g2_i1.p1  ORF type:complete len:288 (+),score=168.57 TRINITY_DN342_c0_g2_i1:57-920(+)